MPAAVARGRLPRLAELLAGDREELPHEAPDSTVWMNTSSSDGTMRVTATGEIPAPASAARMRA